MFGSLPVHHQDLPHAPQVSDNPPTNAYPLWEFLKGLGLWTQMLEPSGTSACSVPLQLPLRPQLSLDCRDLLQRLLERDPSRRISFQDFFAHPWVDLEHMPSGESLARAVSRPMGMG